jgi:predicted metal-dependent TIM-barrel fold hydrolase
MHGLSWDEWELFAMTGMAGAVLSCGNPHVHREIWEVPPTAEDIFRFWDSPIRMARISKEKHFMRVRCAVGISAMTRVEGWEILVEKMPTYLDDPHVVAVGEVGLDPSQYFRLTWPLEDQKRCLEAQARIAANKGKPLILHTPTPKKSKDFLGNLSVQEDISPEDFRLHYLRQDLEVIERAGLDHSLLVIDHVDGTIIDFVHKETNAWCGISIGSALRPIHSNQVTDWVKEYGSDRILLNSDHLGYRSIDFFSMPKTLRGMRRADIPDKDIRRVSFDNANALFGLDL